MRLRQPRATALLLLLPAVRVLSAQVLGNADDSKAARVETTDIAAATGAPAAAAALVPGNKGTKDAPVDGFDGKPHAGPYVDEKTVATQKGPGGIEELRPGSRKPTTAEKEELAAKIEDDDSVMNDKNRESPKGNTGTEGGVSAKDKERLAQEGKTGEKMEKVPESPKEAPELPTSHGEQQHLKDKQEASKDKNKDTDGEKRVLGAQGLEKPTDLPDSPHDIPHPIPPSSEKSNPLDTTPKTGSGAIPEGGEAGGVIQPLHSFILSLTMIIFSEIGDKTFLVAALMAMRHPRILVFSAAFSALIVMTVLSAVLGHAVPTLIPERFTHLAAAGLFLVFGVKLLREGMAMSPDEGVGEEMREVEQELEEKESLARQQKGSRRKSSISPYVLESGRARRSRSNSRLPAPARSPSSSPDRAPSPTGSSLSGALSGLNNLFSLLLSPAWVQTFVMTFLGEWGDRSQIATVAMAAGSDYWWVTGGAIVGHGLCTAGAVIGGRAIAGKVSMRVVTLGGAIAFLAFGVIYLFEAIYHE
ncbi:GCR1-dependent translation factor 1 [Paraconiothyrium brasiliense]|uniref:GCR1-dependent translation factor 1 n=1 Tax=Paraconiothyrium brasiliense TaxID=300254 RepID=A0ABR3QIA3_9PLEO